MTRIPDKARLRNSLRKLDKIRGASVAPADRAEAAQDALDFMAMSSGLKPVFLLGRGFDDPPWIRGMLQVAIDRGLYVIEGPYWEAQTAHADLPEWFVEHARAAFRDLRAHYICRAKAVAEEVEEICAGGELTVAREARLLGYPECCVTAYYERSIAYQKLWLEFLSNAAGGDEAEMRRRLAEGVPLEPASDEDRKRLEQAMEVHPAPFTSVNTCDSCRSGGDTPAMQLSARYRALATAVEPGLARELLIAAAGKP